MKRFLLVAALCAAPLTSVLAGQRLEGQVGAWDIVAATDDATGRFSQCITFVPYKNGINMLVSIDAGFKWRMSFQNPGWRLQQGSTYPINYWIDKSPTLPANALVLGPDMVVVELYDSAALFDAFKHGRTLTLQAAGQQFDFDLTDSSRALQATLECTARYANGSVGVPNDANPFTNAPAQSPANDSAFRIEAATYTANLLAAAGIPGFRIVETPPPGFEGYHSAFVSDGMVGGMMVAPGWTVDSAANEMMTVMSSGCNGKVATAKQPIQGTGAHVQVVCERSDGTREEGSYFVIAREKGGVYAVVIQQVPPPVQSTLPPPAQGAPSADDISTKLLDASAHMAR